MRKAVFSINELKKRTNKVLLFHSGTGKDSIALLDLLHPHFDEIVCVYMYIIKDLEHINKYIYWAKKKYGVKFLQMPHYAMGSYIKHGFMGLKANPKQKLYTLADVNERAVLKTGIPWTVFGFKQSDSMNRRLMLRTYDCEATINFDTKKAYPLSEYKNGDVLRYIKNKKLLTPINYGGHHQSSGTSLADINFLLYCKYKFPNDYKKIIEQFPETEHKVWQYENRGNF